MLIEATDLALALPDFSKKRPFRPAPTVEILKGLTFAIRRGQTVGIVGRSGCGKSTLGRTLVRLHAPTGGRLTFNGTDITELDAADLRPLRRDLQVIFQDPLSALNPRRTIAAIVADPLQLHDVADAPTRAREALDAVGLGRPFLGRYAHELSGGQRQRVGIARAIALRPKFIFADEIVSGLDTSTQAQVIALLRALQKELRLTLAFVSHDLSVVRHLCDTVMVMAAGQIVERGPTARVFDDPQHAETKALKAAIPLPEVDRDWLGAPLRPAAAVI
ncbi:MAG: ABC transporter ATP-binding protein [Pseudomonadota bacterium]